MATLLAPYNTAMKLGSGFNSFTQQLCIDRAVVREQKEENITEKAQKNVPIAQEVVYKTAIVDKVTDVTNAMNINPAFSIKYDAFDAKGKGDFINTSKVKESDISFMISVKVINQVIQDHALTKFDPIPDLKTANFADVYGDCFISGFQEGGEFTAVISIKAKNRQKVDSLKANAAISFTKDKLAVAADGDFGKTDTSFLEENETTVSVTYIGGGQDLKARDEDWSFDTMKAAALKFPDLVAKTPMRTHVILTKYSSLRSFYETTFNGHKAVIPNFERAGVYTTILQEAYLDYKTISKNLQVLAYDASSGIQTLSDSPAALAIAAKAKYEGEASLSEPTKATEEKVSDGEDSDSLVAVSSSVDREETVVPLRITEPYPPTLAGIESARHTVRFMLNRIVAEVDLVTRNPDVATDEKRRLPYMSPFLFKDFLPVGSGAPTAPVDIASTDSSTKPDENDTAGLLSMADRMGGKLRI